jgi:hypothetical protein
LDAVAGEVLEAADVVEPPVDAFLVARRLGICVAADDRQHGRARYVRLHHRHGSRFAPTVLLRGDPRPERRQWALAHEIGEHIAVRAFERFDIDARECPGLRERVANWLAARLLLPADWFFPLAASCDWDLLALKESFATASHELIARRMLDGPAPLLVSVFDNDRPTFRRSNRHRGAPALLSAEARCQHLAHESGRPQQTEGDFHSVRAWPIHESDWKREILRTEIDPFAEMGTPM